MKTWKMIGLIAVAVTIMLMLSSLSAYADFCSPPGVNPNFTGPRIAVPPGTSPPRVYPNFTTYKASNPNLTHPRSTGPSVTTLNGVHPSVNYGSNPKTWAAPASSCPSTYRHIRLP